MKEVYKDELETFGEIETEDKIVCPYCGNEHELDSEYFESSSEYDEEDFQCYSCEKFFKVHAEVRFEFWSTTKF